MSDRRIKEVLGTILAVFILLICSMTYAQEINLPIKEEVLAGSYINSEVAGEKKLEEISAILGKGIHGQEQVSRQETESIKACEQENLLSIDTESIKPAVPGLIAELPNSEIPVTKPDDSFVSGNVTDSPEGENSMGNDTDTDAESGTETGADVGEDGVADGGTIEEIQVNPDGFCFDAEGMIVGCENVMVTDGVLAITPDKTCTGIRAGAFSSLGSDVTEIFIPANIVKIEPGAFDGLSSLFYIEVHPGNPSYMSMGGVLYNVDGTISEAAPFIR